MYKLFVWGYWVNNYGDDLFLYSLSNYLKSCNCKIYINTYNKYSKNYKKKGFHTVNYDSLFNRIFRRLLKKDRFFLMSKNNYFIALGGSLFCENKSKNTEENQLFNLNYATKSSKKSFVIGSNFGPYETDSFLNDYKLLFSLFDRVSFRDDYSCKIINDNRIKWYPDVVLSGLWDTCDYVEPTVKNDYILFSVINLRGRSSIQQYTSVYEKKIVDLAVDYINNGFDIILASFCEKEGDVEVCDIIKKRINKNNVFIIKNNSDNIASYIKNAKKVYSTRFHATILSIYYNVDFLPIIYNEKIKYALNSYYDNYCFVDLKSINNYNTSQLMKLSNKKSGLIIDIKESNQHFECLEFIKE